MDASLLKDMIRLIKAEQSRREAELPEEDEDGSVYAQWAHVDLPFVNELYLMLLVAIRHQVEKELYKLAASASNDGKDLTSAEFQAELKKLKDQRKGAWKTIEERLKLKLYEQWKCLGALREMSNCYKHEPYSRPSKELLKLLRLETGVNYAELSQSRRLQEGLAVFIGLHKDAGYSDITERFLDLADRFLKEVAQSDKTKISKVKGGHRVSSASKDAAR
jgi:hypothetical protein